MCVIIFFQICRNDDLTLISKIDKIKETTHTTRLWRFRLDKRGKRTTKRVRIMLWNKWKGRRVFHYFKGNKSEHMWYSIQIISQSIHKMKQSTFTCTHFFESVPQYSSSSAYSVWSSPSIYINITHAYGWVRYIVWS